jgi:hypothetical protein
MDEAKLERRPFRIIGNGFPCRHWFPCGIGEMASISGEGWRSLR